MTKSDSMDFIAIFDAASCPNLGAQILGFSHSGSFGASILIFMVNCAWAHSTFRLYTLLTPTIKKWVRLDRAIIYSPHEQMIFCSAPKFNIILFF
jgi:hypothetical protein